MGRESGRGTEDEKIENNRGLERPRKKERETDREAVRQRWKEGRD